MGGAGGAGRSSRSSGNGGCPGRPGGDGTGGAAHGLRPKSWCGGGDAASHTSGGLRGVPSSSTRGVGAWLPQSDSSSRTRPPSLGWPMPGVPPVPSLAGSLQHAASSCPRQARAPLHPHKSATDRTTLWIVSAVTSSESWPPPAASSSLGTSPENQSSTQRSTALRGGSSSKSPTDFQNSRIASVTHALKKAAARCPAGSPAHAPRAPPHECCRQLTSFAWTLLILSSTTRPTAAFTASLGIRPTPASSLLPEAASASWLQDVRVGAPPDGEDAPLLMPPHLDGRGASGTFALMRPGSAVRGASSWWSSSVSRGSARGKLLGRQMGSQFTPWHGLCTRST
mmetsp:Transcript_114231/g.323518  ORF Transcript_114231/g.323518 Transcript_114231/m.323518 type:complete len:340 (-) Transcript_114231:52-1071(-)